MVILLIFTIVLGLILGQKTWLFSQIVLGLIWLFLVNDLVRFIQRNNLIMSRFITSLRYKDYESVALSNGSTRLNGGMIHAMKQISHELNDAKKEFTHETQLLHQVIQDVKTPLVVLDEQGEIVLANVSFQDNFGRFTQRDELKESHPELFDALNNSNGLGEQRIIASDGQTGKTNHIRINKQRIGGHEYRFVEIRSTGNEHTEEPGQYQRMLNVVSHEVRNGLSPVLSLSDTLRESLQTGSTLSKENMVKALDAIHKQAETLKDFVGRHLQKIQIPPPNKATTTWNAFFETIPAFQHEFVNISGDGLNDEVRIDQSQLLQVFTNLLENALAFQRKDKPLRIEIEVGTLSDEFQLVFSDNGRGIPSEIRQDIFTPFISGRADGAGLGLSICRRIIENHQGRIRLLHSDENGTAFVLYLPNG
jgi:signal transduction histidine kinase